MIRLAALALTVALTGCAEAGPTVRIVLPIEGEVSGPSVLVRLEASGIEIAPATDPRPGTGHHHLFLDIDAVAPGEAIPMGMPGIVHLGQGQSEHTFEGLIPGNYRLIAVIADPAHIALTPAAVDTVRFVVR